jgi:predicted permease
VGQEVQAELDAHFEGTVELLVARGFSEEEARAEARARFGQLDLYRRALERMERRRRIRGWARSTVEATGASVTDAIRGLRRSPGFVVAVVVTLALGIGANAAIFRVVDELLLSPPDQVERPEQVRRLYQVMRPAQDEPRPIGAFTYSDVRALRGAGLPARVAAFTVGLPETLGEGEGASRVRVARVDSAFLPLLGVAAARGRAFALDDHRTGATPVALIGHTLWRTRFGSDPGVVGRTLRVGPGTYEVVGVLPRGFAGAPPPAIDVWLPLEAVAEDMWGPGWEADQRILAFSLLARLTGESAEAVLASDAAAILRTRTDYPLDGELVGLTAFSLVPGDAPNPRFASVVTVSRWLSGVSLLVLLVACANVANLFLAQGERARRETAVRMAIGAGSARLRVELLLRALVLALVGAGVALALATCGGTLLDGLFITDMEISASQDAGRLVTFTAVLATVAAALSGFLPAVRAPRGDLRSALGDGGRTTPLDGGLRRSLVAIQTALSTVLIVGSTLFVLSLRRATEVDLGFDPEGLVMVRIEQEREEDLSSGRLEDLSSGALYEDVEDMLRGLPGVSSATRTVAVPFVMLFGRFARLPGEDTITPSADRRPVGVNGVGADFFTTMGIELLRGRAIETRDLGDGADPVAVVSRGAAGLLWPGENPLGKCVLAGPAEAPCARVVGVAAEHAARSIEEEPPPTTWVALDYPGMTAPTAVMVRVAGDADRAAAQLRRQISGLPGVRYAEVGPMTEFVDGQMRAWRLGAVVFSLFGLIALGVAAVGLYGILSYDVAQRRREIGVRIALGAGRGRLIGRVLQGALATSAIGLGAGLLVSIWGAARLESLLFQVSPRDPQVFARAIAIVLVSATVAAAIPAWRATGVDPREALEDR